MLLENHRLHSRFKLTLTKHQCIKKLKCLNNKYNIYNIKMIEFQYKYALMVHVFGRK